MRDASNFRTIKATVAKFTEEGTVCDLHKGRSDQKKCGRSKDSGNMVRQAVVRSPKKLIPRLSAETNLHRCSVKRILCQDVDTFPYKIQSLPAYEQKEKRLHFVNWLAKKLEEDAAFLKELYMTHECHSHLSGVVNKQNFRY